MPSIWGLLTWRYRRIEDAWEQKAVFVRLPAFDRYDGEEGQEEGGNDGQYTLQIRIRLLEAFQLGFGSLCWFI